MLRHDMEYPYKKTIPLTMLTDRKKMFDEIKKSSENEDPRLMIDI